MIKKLLPVFVWILLFHSLAVGEDFFPIGMFSVGPENLEIVRRAGFNTAHTYLTDPAMLQECIQNAESAGLKLLLYPSERGDKGVVDFQKMTQFIKRNKSADSILAWFIADEPELNGATPSQIMEIHQRIKYLDSSRPTAVVIKRTDRYGKYKDSSDVIMTDRYPVPKVSLNHVAETTRWAVMQKGNTGPVWAILQAFGYQNPQMKGWGQREPTYDEMRAMTFLSIIYGAKGIFYFTFTGSQYKIMESPQHWSDLQRIVAELNSLYPLLLANGDYSKVAVEIIDGPQKDERGLPSVHITEKLLTMDAGHFEPGRYYIAANATDQNVKASFSVNSPLKQLKHIGRFGQTGRVKCTGGSFSDTFRPYGVHVYAAHVSPDDGATISSERASR